MTRSTSFHPIWGHVREGEEILFTSGRILTIRNCMTGWRLCEKDGTAVTPPHAAYELTQAIRRIEEGNA